jgi:uncharacterized protein YoxC
MDMVISISVAIIAGLLFVNTLFLVMVLIRAFTTLGEARKLLEMVRLQISPVTHDLTQILSDARAIVRSVQNDMGKVSDSITAVRDTMRNLHDFETMVQERIERPLLDITAVVSAFYKGGRVFWNNFFKR